MRSATLFAMVCASLAAGCGAQWLPTTIAHVALAADATPTDEDWCRLARAHELVAIVPIDEDAFLAWTANGDHGTLARVRRTELGLETQSSGPHVGSHVRPSIRALVVAGVRIVIVESSANDSSTDREAWIYAEHADRIVALTIDGAPARLRVRATQTTPLEHGWSRVATLTATFEAVADALVVHEHASVREEADDRPELPARSTYEVERARAFQRRSERLHADRPSLFDEPSAR